ncbi:MAG: MarR family transcriptional regulator [Candidatus Hydrogenedentes bacterium]|nr:MarR family transcriptional regulator [Candidatus Hydrogenedentota bacterium]
MKDYSREAKEIFQTIQLIHKWLHRYFQVSCEDRERSKIGHDLTMPQFHMLITIKEHGPMNLKELSEKLGVSSSSASLMLDKLVEMGYVLREQSEEDRREINIRLSSYAEKTLEIHEEQILRAFSDLLAGLDEGTVKQWLGTYRRVRKFLEENLVIGKK